MFIMRCKHRNCPVGRDALIPPYLALLVHYKFCDVPDVNLLGTMLASSRMMGLCLYISPRHSKYSGGHTMCGPTGGMYSKCWLPIIKCTCRERSIPALPRGKTTHVALFKTCYKIYACPGRRGRRHLQKSGKSLAQNLQAR